MAAEPMPEQTELLGVSVEAGHTVAVTTDAEHLGRWWHAWTPAGAYQGATNDRAYLPYLLEQGGGR
jgi:hypothetical protein